MKIFSLVQTFTTLYEPAIPLTTLVCF